MEDKALITTRENLFSMVAIMNQAVQVRFHPISLDWYNYGRTLTIIKIFDKDEELLKNVSSKQFSVGKVDCLAIQNNSLDEPIQVSINSESIIEIKDNCM